MDIDYHYCFKMLKIRLKRFGRKRVPIYRIVVMDSRTRRDGRSIEEIGLYNPISKEFDITDIRKLFYWLSKGAQCTNTVAFLLYERWFMDVLNTKYNYTQPDSDPTLSSILAQSEMSSN